MEQWRECLILLPDTGNRWRCCHDGIMSGLRHLEKKIWNESLCHTDPDVLALVFLARKLALSSSRLLS
jgi:hypothetical protein